MSIRFRTGIFVGVVSISLGAGCAHNPPRAGDHGVSPVKSVTSPVEKAPDEEWVVLGVRLENTDFDIPIEINGKVEEWVKYFTGKGRKHFERYLERSEHFIPFIQPLLRANGLPEDLVYLAMIESGFNNHAKSHAKAVGPWQFIPWTGRRYGLMVNWWVDERRDTRKSTLSAAYYLRDLYSIFGSWELAASAYNAGEAKVARAIRRFGTKDFWALSRQKFFRPETRNYVPKIMAAAIVAKNRTLFGFLPTQGEKLSEGEVLAGDGRVVKVVEQENPQADAEQIEAVTDEVTEEYLSDESDPSIPSETFASFVEQPKTWNDGSPKARAVLVPTVNRAGKLSGEEIAEFEVQSPADLLKIAKAASLSYQTVKAMNPEILRWCTPPHVKSYRIKLPAAAKDKFVMVYNHGAFPRKVEFLTHKVRQGDTVDRIARHFGIQAEPISELNGISRRSYLRRGEKILLPMPSDRTRSVASLDLRESSSPSRRRTTRRKSKPISYRISIEDRARARSAGPNRR